MTDSTTLEMIMNKMTEFEARQQQHNKLLQKTYDLLQTTSDKVAALSMQKSTPVEIKSRSDKHRHYRILFGDR